MSENGTNKALLPANSERRVKERRKEEERKMNYERSAVAKAMAGK